jgi:PAS domain S-box-containing protein
VLVLRCRPSAVPRPGEEDLDGQMIHLDHDAESRPPVTSRSMSTTSVALLNRLSEMADVVVMRYRLEPPPGIEFVSPSSLPILGYSPDEFYASPALGLEIVHPEDRERLARHCRRDPERTFVGRAVRKDGCVRWIERRQRRVCDRHGRRPYLEATLRDVTVQHEAEEALRESQLRFRTAFEHAPIGMALVAIGGDWLEVNRSFCEFLGYDEGELRRTTWQALTHPEDLDADLASARATLEGRIDGYTMEKRYLRKDGAIVLGRLNVALVRSPEGEPRYFISQLEDITPRRLRSDPAAAHERVLTQRQLGVLRLLADGRSTSQIAEELYLSKTTVRNHIARLLANLGVHSRVQAVVVATRLGLIDVADPAPSPEE